MYPCVINFVKGPATDYFEIFTMHRQKVQFISTSFISYLNPFSLLLFDLSYNKCLINLFVVSHTKSVISAQMVSAGSPRNNLSAC